MGLYRSRESSAAAQQRTDWKPELPHKSQLAKAYTPVPLSG